jgi:hypothetical protein
MRHVFGVVLVLVLVGAVMIVPLFVPSRWRRPAEDDYADEPSEFGLMRLPPGPARKTGAGRRGATAGTSTRGRRLVGPRELLGLG